VVGDGRWEGYEVCGSGSSAGELEGMGGLSWDGMMVELDGIGDEGKGEVGTWRWVYKGC